MIERKEENKETRDCLNWRAKGSKSSKRKREKETIQGKKKSLKTQTWQPAFKNTQVKGKAMKKLTRALPNTPTKEVDIIKTFIKSLNPNTKQKVTSNNIVSYNIILE